MWLPYSMDLVKFIMRVSKGMCSRSGLKVICGLMRVLKEKRKGKVTKDREEVVPSGQKR